MKIKDMRADWEEKERAKAINEETLVGLDDDDYSDEIHTFFEREKGNQSVSQGNGTGEKTMPSPDIAPRGSNSPGEKEVNEKMA